MPTQEIANPSGAFGYSDGEQKYPRRIDPFVADGAIAAGDVVTFQWTETGQVLKVKKADVAGSPHDPASVAGVAYEAAADGETVRVVTWGFAIVNIDDATVAASELAHFHSSADGAADSTAADASTVAGDSFGVMLGDEIGTSNTAPIWVDRI